MTRAAEAIAFLRQQIDAWFEQSRERPSCNSLTDTQVKNRMAGHAMWDDPPRGYSKRRLADWSRGYLWGRSVEAGNAAKCVDFALQLEQPPEENCRAWDLSRGMGLKFVQDYAFDLQEHLDEFTEGSEAKHYVKILTSPTLSAVSIEIVHDKFREQLPAWLEQAIAAGFQTCYRGNTAIAYQHSEYPLREELGIHVKSENIIHVCHPSNYHFWSNVQAWEDSNDIIATVLNASNKNLSEPP